MTSEKCINTVFALFAVLYIQLTITEIAQNYRKNFIEMVKEKEMNEKTRVKNDG
jgi:hypothetical protein